MPIFEITSQQIVPLQETTFEKEGLRERDDLQRLMRERIDTISPETLIIAEEFGGWEDSRRRIDLLGVDKQAVSNRKTRPLWTGFSLTKPTK